MAVHVDFAHMRRQTPEFSYSTYQRFAKTWKMNTTAADIEFQGLRFSETFRCFCYLSQHVPEE